MTFDNFTQTLKEIDETVFLLDFGINQRSPYWVDLRV